MDCAEEAAPGVRVLSSAEGLVWVAFGVEPEFTWLLLPLLVLAEPAWLPACSLM